MTPTLLIRRVEPGDFEPWKILWDRYNAFYGREGPTAMHLYDQVAERTAAIVYRRML